ncbi:hypothetical protein [Streptomyces litchfieldiae]|uniref:Uncharacterized protein n=1 Tax=Streptomyces litchfieldiae TaxID=3075543 RepID=A0ABU2N1U0_9ACTN|nr:hypothetical protein [Streptomyces sp. DSM 44938]MDT0347740.1 hypothetical protein [Streptomyces sp. DSM 44938]
MPGISPPERFAKYHTARMAAYTDVCTVLCHTTLPWVAFAATAPDVGQRPAFVQPPDWAGHFTRAGFTVPALPFLTMPATDAGLSALPAWERGLVEGWLPITPSLGHIVFNSWP